MNPLVKTGLLRFPITAKLKPVSAENVRYLAETAVLTRLMIGAVRVYQNKPNRNQDPDVSQLDKRKTFLERVFVELVGTLGYLLVLHGGQDITAKLLESTKRYDVNHFVRNAEWFSNLSDREQKRFLQGVNEVFGEKWGRMERVLFGPGRQNGNMLNALKKQLNNPRLFAKVEEGMTPYVHRLNRAASASVLGGVALSALFGGLVIQWVNDRLVSPIISVLLDEFTGNGRANHPMMPSMTPQSPVVDRFQRTPNNTPYAPPYTPTWQGRQPS